MTRDRRVPARPRPSSRPWAAAAVVVAGRALLADEAAPIRADDAAPASLAAPLTAPEAGATPPPIVAPPALIPPAGAYSYLASGGQSTRLLIITSRHEVAARVPAQVSVSGGCWDWTLAILPDHTETHHLCAGVEGGLTDLGGSQRQAAFGLKVGVAVSCQPPGWLVRPGMSPGDVWPASCALQNSGADSGRVLSEGPTVYLGPEALEVGGAPVDTWHLRQTWAITGSQEGTNTVDLWIARSNGMIARMDRRMVYRSPLTGPSTWMV